MAGDKCRNGRSIPLGDGREMGVNPTKYIQRREGGNGGGEGKEEEEV